MPYKPSRQCPGHGPHRSHCPNTIKGTESYCAVCSEYYDAELRQKNKKYDQCRDQNKERAFIHSPQWRKIRLMKFTKDPLCEVCLGEGRETMAVLVHHIDGNELNNSYNNHQSICNDCHEEIHKSERWSKK